jgi:hypothetical protein
MLFSEEFYRYYCDACWPPTSLTRDLITVPNVGVFRVKSCPVHGPVLVEDVVRFNPPREVKP